MTGHPFVSAMCVCSKFALSADACCKIQYTQKTCCRVWRLDASLAQFIHVSYRSTNASRLSCQCLVAATLVSISLSRLPGFVVVIYTPHRSIYAWHGSSTVYGHLLFRGCCGFCENDGNCFKSFDLADFEADFRRNASSSRNHHHFTLGIRYDIQTKWSFGIGALIHVGLEWMTRFNWIDIDNMTLAGRYNTHFEHSRTHTHKHIYILCSLRCVQNVYLVSILVPLFKLSTELSRYKPTHIIYTLYYVLAHQYIRIYYVQSKRENFNAVAECDKLLGKHFWNVGQENT